MISRVGRNFYFKKSALSAPSALLCKSRVGNRLQKNTPNAVRGLDRLSYAASIEQRIKFRSSSREQMAKREPSIVSLVVLLAAREHASARKREKYVNDLCVYNAVWKLSYFIFCKGCHIYIIWNYSIRCSFEIPLTSKTAKIWFCLLLKW